MKIAYLFAFTISCEASVIGLGGGINCELDSLFDVTCSASGGFTVSSQYRKRVFIQLLGVNCYCFCKTVIRKKLQLTPYDQNFEL